MNFCAGTHPRTFYYWLLITTLHYPLLSSRLPLLQLQHHLFPPANMPSPNPHPPFSASHKLHALHQETLKKPLHKRLDLDLRHRPTNTSSTREAPRKARPLPFHPLLRTCLHPSLRSPLLRVITKDVFTATNVEGRSIDLDMAPMAARDEMGAELEAGGGDSAGEGEGRGRVETQGLGDAGVEIRSRSGVRGRV